MKALRIELYQETVCYKKPFAFKVTETYPLPPYSTVIGMLHNVLQATEYKPMKISVQGGYESIFNSYNSMYFFKSKVVTTMPININMLFGVDLLIHVEAEEELLEEIYSKFKSCEFLSLGRKEDLARLKNIEFVEVREVDSQDLSKSFMTKNSIYIPKALLNDEVYGINYRLNKNYHINGDIRQWNKIDVLYVEKGIELGDEILLLDKYDDLVCFA